MLKDDIMITITMYLLGIISYMVVYIITTSSNDSRDEPTLKECNYKEIKSYSDINDRMNKLVNKINKLIRLILIMMLINAILFGMLFMYMIIIYN